MSLDLERKRLEMQIAYMTASVAIGEAPKPADAFVAGWNAACMVMLRGSRESQLEDLLVSARCIAKRKGEDTDWEVFDKRIASFGIGSVTPRVFHLPRSDDAA